jgi:hypothetical protein
VTSTVDRGRAAAVEAFRHAGFTVTEGETRPNRLAVRRDDVLVTVWVSTRNGFNYPYWVKSDWEPDVRHFACLVRLPESDPAEVYVIPTTVWEAPDNVFVSRDYPDLKSPPEWGINLSARNLPALQRYRMPGAASLLADLVGGPAASPRVSEPSSALENATVGEVRVASSTQRGRALAPGADYRKRAAGELNAWWQDDPAERFWLGITDRPDVGIDLHCPQRDASGNRTPGYSLIWWVRHDDIVFHYDKNQHAITGWSRAVGDVAEAPVVWLSHRGATRRRLGAARAQPGWWLDLEGPYALTHALTLEQLRASGSAVRGVMDELRQRESGALYFPFFFYGGPSCARCSRT